MAPPQYPIEGLPRSLQVIHPGGLTMKLPSSLSFIVVALSSSLAWAQAPSNDPKAPTFEISDFGVVPRPAVTQVLLRLPAVEQELKITDGQKKQQAEIEKKRAEKLAAGAHGKRRSRQVLA